MEKKINKNDIILIVMLLGVAIASYLGIEWYQAAHTTQGVAVVTIDGEEYGRYPLTVNTTEKIILQDGAYNLLEIKEGEANIIDASCPDKICVNHRAISKNGQSIVCLPNKLVVEIANGKEAEIDFIVN